MMMMMMMMIFLFQKEAGGTSGLCGNQLPSSIYSSGQYLTVCFRYVQLLALHIPSTLRILMSIPGSCPCYGIIVQPAGVMYIAQRQISNSCMFSDSSAHCC